VTLLIDDTPEAVVISGFDPVRREIARQALEALVADGRIHPARIEEEVAKAQANLDETILQAGREAAYEARQQHVDTELLRMLGRLKFRTSYSQNVLQHALEVSRLMGVILADETGPRHRRWPGASACSTISARAPSHEAEGGHAHDRRRDSPRRAREDPLVVNAVESHHEESRRSALYAVLCSAADAISSSRPGARSEMHGDLRPAPGKAGGDRQLLPGRQASTFAIQAGREVRVIVDPERRQRQRGHAAGARDRHGGSRRNLRYPGQIRVVVIREQRCCRSSTPGETQQSGQSCNHVNNGSRTIRMKILIGR
jgi:ribonuclease Y